MHERTRGEVVPEMVVETQELLENEGVDDERIYTEDWEYSAAE